VSKPILPGGLPFGNGRRPHPPEVRRALANLVGPDGSWRFPQGYPFDKLDKATDVSLRAAKDLYSAITRHAYNGLCGVELAYLRDRLAAVHQVLANADAALTEAEDENLGLWGAGEEDCDVD
jgi:hypothetical protein